MAGGYRFGRPALWTVLVIVLVLVLDLAGFDYDYENDDEEDALRVCRRFTREEVGRAVLCTPWHARNPGTACRGLPALPAMTGVLPNSV